jgi:RNA polymerase sigma-70 factor (ECF subfamily)
MNPMTRPNGPQGETDEPRDDALVQRTLQGDQRAFEVLVRRYERLVFRIAGGFLRDRRDVEDAAQEAFLRAFGALSRFRSGASFGPWIAQIVTRLCYDRLRARRGREVGWEDLSPAEQQAASSVAGGVASGVGAVNRDLAERVLTGVSPKERQILLLREVMGYTAAESAKVLGCSELAARIRLHRARRAMQRVAERLLDGMDHSA